MQIALAKHASRDALLLKWYRGNSRKMGRSVNNRQEPGVVSGERADCFSTSAATEHTSSASTGRGSRRAAQLQPPRCETRPAFFDPTPAAPT